MADKLSSMQLESIGIIHTHYHRIEDIPRQGRLSSEICDVELLDVKENRIRVLGMDAMDGSILLDIKPYSAEIDSFPHAKIAWQMDGEA
ncbi:MAG: TrmO family methyltransferase [Methanothrix sp.]